MAVVNYNIEDNKLHIIIQTTNGNFQILADTIVDPEGDRCVIYDCYCISLKSVRKSATDINYYVDKIKRFLDYYEEIGGSFLKIIMFKMIQDHIGQHGRIIDNDLMMIVSAMAQTIKVIEGGCDFKTIIDSAIIIALNQFVDKTFITIYDQTIYGVQPRLIPLKEYSI